MKKLTLNLILVAFGIWRIQDANAVPHIQPVRSLEIPYTNGVIIDGFADASYSASQSTTAFVVSGSTGADADFTASFQACYNSQRLYLLATVLDDYANEIPYTTGVNPWTWDCMEVLISLDTTGTTEYYDTNTIQLRFNRGIQDSAQTRGRAYQSEYYGFVFSENTAEGWILEVGIPWKAVLSDAQLPEDIESYLYAIHGLDVMFSDNDTDGPDARDCMTAWDEDDPTMPDATEDLAWNTRTAFGVMTLLSEGSSYKPVADAGIDQTVDENTLVTLDGTGSYDPDEGIITYLWSASSPISLSDTYSDSPTFIAPEVAENTSYSISLTVNDGTSDSNPDRVIINVQDVNGSSESTAELKETPTITLFPNPTNRFMNIKSGKVIYSIEIIDLSGDVIWRESINALDASVNIASFSAGNYVLRLNTAAGIVTKQIVLE